MSVQRTCPYGLAWGMVATRRPFVHAPAYLVPARGSAGSANVLRAQLANGQLLHDRSFDVEVQIVSRTSATAGTMAYRIVDAGQPIGPPWPFDFSSGEATSLDLSLEISAWRAGALHPTGLYVWLDPALKDTSLPWDGIVAGDRYFVNVSDGRVMGGPTWDGRDFSTLHQMVECSGRGWCDRSVGQCVCDGGYAGIACQRLACPNACSGHGLCQSQRQFALTAAQEAGVARVPSGVAWIEDWEAVVGAEYPSYALAYDAEKAAGCLCDPGFLGPRCDQRQCPSVDDPLGGPGGTEGRDCSGRGTCNSATGECLCFPGFVGSACEQISTLV